MNKNENNYRLKSFNTLENYFSLCQKAILAETLPLRITLFNQAKLEGNRLIEDGIVSNSSELISYDLFSEFTFQTFLEGLELLKGKEPIAKLLQVSQSISLNQLLLTYGKASYILTFDELSVKISLASSLIYEAITKPFELAILDDVKNYPSNQEETGYYKVNAINPVLSVNPLHDFLSIIELPKDDYLKELIINEVAETIQDDEERKAFSENIHETFEQFYEVSKLVVLSLREVYLANDYPIINDSFKKVKNVELRPLTPQNTTLDDYFYDLLQKDNIIESNSENNGFDILLNFDDEKKQLVPFVTGQENIRVSYLPEFLPEDIYIKVSSDEAVCVMDVIAEDMAIFQLLF